MLGKTGGASQVGFSTCSSWMNCHTPQPMLTACCRAATALYIHDAEYTALFNTEPFMRHSTSKLPSLCSDNLWLASTVDEWEKLVGNASQNFGTLLGDLNMPSPIGSGAPESHCFSLYCQLEGIAAEISEARQLGTLSDTWQQRESALLDFHRSHLETRSRTDADPFCLGILWHLVFISLFADINQLEISAGREGYEQAQRHFDDTRAWAKSQQAERCAIHGVLLLRKAQKMCISAEPAIHVPRALFCASLIWYCYTEFGQDNADDRILVSNDFPEFQQLGICGQDILFEAHGFKKTRPSRLESMVIIGLHDLLRRMGHWDISRKFASLVICILYGEVSDDPRSVMNRPHEGG